MYRGDQREGSWVSRHLLQRQEISQESKMGVLGKGEKEIGKEKIIPQEEHSEELERSHLNHAGKDTHAHEKGRSRAGKLEKLSTLQKNKSY